MATGSLGEAGEREEHAEGPGATDDQANADTFRISENIKEMEEDRYDIKSGTLKKIDSSLMIQINQKEGIIHSLISLPQ